MEPLVTHTGNTAVLPRVNVDTDQIIPKQFLKRVERTGFGQFLFFDWRFLEDGSDNPDFELNQPQAEGATVLLADHNFGSGSSREHAPWALQDYGFRVIIAPSFADIFYSNCFKNGILPIRLEEEKVYRLMEKGKNQKYDVMVDLPTQKITDEQGFEETFDIDNYYKEMLVNGWDEISITLQYEDKIDEFEKSINV